MARTKVLVVSAMVSDGWTESGKVKHNRALAPVRSISCPSADLSKQVVVWATELDIDSASIRGSHE